MLLARAVSILKRDSHPALRIVDALDPVLSAALPPLPSKDVARSSGALDPRE